MRALIRFLTRGPGGTLEQRDKQFEGDAITLGRATDQVLHLKDRRAELEHARIFRRGERVLIASPAVAGVIVNGAVRRDAALAPGDVVGVGSNTLKLFEAPAGFDVAFTFELDSSARAAEAARQAPVLDLAGTRLAKRPWAWALFIVVVLTVLIVPALGMRGAGLSAMLRTSAMPDDGWWSSGALSAAHQGIGTACESCHALPFIRVRDAECLECHAPTLREHHRTDFEKMPGYRCTTCHIEHNEPDALVQRDSRICGECHRDTQAVLAHRPHTLPATDFAKEHPEFRVSLFERTTTYPGPVERRMRLSEAKGLDASGLKFPHDVHLDPRGLKTPQGQTMQMSCGRCHQPSEDGTRMLPIEMERDCASCHRLDFEPADPGRAVPHGDADAVLQTLVEYYSARYLEEYPDAHATAAPARTVARPGIDLTAEQRARALERARTKAMATARDIFERRTCFQCHTVRPGTTADGAPTWSVEWTVLNDRWMRQARFSHASHSTTLTECETCHAAADSKRSSDVLMPGIVTCRECHGGARVASGSNLVPSDCALCHAFHDPSSEPWVDPMSLH